MTQRDERFLSQKGSIYRRGENNRHICHAAKFIAERAHGRKRPYPQKRAHRKQRAAEENQRLATHHIIVVLV